MTMKEAPRDEIACEQTVLHQAGAVQNGSGLLLLERDQHSIFAANATLLGTYGTLHNLEDIFSLADAAAVRHDISVGIMGEARFLRLTKGEFVWARFYEADDYLAIDLTYTDEALLAESDANHKFARCVADMTHENDLAMHTHPDDAGPYFEKLTAGLQDLTGFDRVMVYKFDSDLNGEVISETLSSPQVPAFMGLKFPSGDIPKPARDLFLLNKVRQIIEVEAPPDPIMRTDGDPAPVIFDQSHASFRYTSPVHLDYLTNMQVNATLTIGIVVGQALWGLVSCHHMSGRKQVPANTLTLCHVLSDLASNHIARLIDRQRANASAMTSSLLSRVSNRLGTLQSVEAFEDVMTDCQDDLLRILRADGLQFESETANWIAGDLPDRDIVTQLDRTAAAWQKTHDRNYVATADLHRFCPDLPEAAKPFGGFLHAVSWDKKTCLRVFRKAAAQSKVWAGDPNAKSRYENVRDEVLHPRNSFAAYLVHSNGCSEIWEDRVVQICRDLQSGFRNIEMTLHKSLRERQLRQSNAEMRQALTNADHQAHHDPLTGICNRRGFERFLDRLVTRADRNNNMWLFHVDVDHFKKINDTFGHQAGDAVLVHIGTILQDVAQEPHKAARIGGDEFIVILPTDLDQDAVKLLCAEMFERLRVPFFFEGAEIRVSCTFGITAFVAGEDSSNEILARSDLALYAGKSRGRGVFEFFSPNMENDRKAHRQIEVEIERALEAEEFVPYFQPQVDVITRNVVGFEMLSRWLHPTKGLLGPHDYLQVAQSMGALDDIDRQMFFKAVDLQSQWADKTGRRMPVSVNVSLDRLRSDALVSDLKSIGTHAQDLTLELLESIDLNDGDFDFLDTMNELRNTGVGIEIDDFGAGRTSILAVLKVQPDRLKIDKRLIDPIAGDKSARNVVKSVIGIGNQLGISSLAEGVETVEQVDILSDLNCERIQGYFFGKPQSASTTEATLLAVA